MVALFREKSRNEIMIARTRTTPMLRRFQEGPERCGTVVRVLSMASRLRVSDDICMPFMKKFTNVPIFVIPRFHAI